MTNYARGIYLEGRVMDILRDAGWYCMRSAGSHGLVDVIALKQTRVALIQSKISGNLGHKDWNALYDTARFHGATPLLARRPGRTGVEFLELTGPRDRMERTASFLRKWEP